jgi:hypothetical protein
VKYDDACDEGFTLFSQRTGKVNGRRDRRGRARSLYLFIERINQMKWKGCVVVETSVGRTPQWFTVEADNVAAAEAIFRSYGDLQGFTTAPEWEQNTVQSSSGGGGLSAGELLGFLSLIAGGMFLQWLGLI